MFLAKLKMSSYCSFQLPGTAIGRDSGSPLNQPSRSPTSSGSVRKSQNHVADRPGGKSYKEYGERGSRLHERNQSCRGG